MLRVRARALRAGPWARSAYSLPAPPGRRWVLAKAQGLTAKSKHFERWAAYVRDLFQRHIIGVEYVNTDDMPADIFTKPLPFDAFAKHRATLLNA